jgi:hypothetical protein
MPFTNLRQIGLLAIYVNAALAASLTPTNVPAANPKVLGFSAPNILSPELREALVVQGSFELENPSDLTSFYGYDNDGPLLPAPGDVPATGHKVEATKTEPDKNTYLVLEFQRGADRDYNYGAHFLFQGHEGGVDDHGYITRVNLDADGPHRITLMADKDVNGQPLPVFDGSTWYPFSHHLLFTAENGADGGVWQATLDVPSTVEDISGILGRAGYEGIQADNNGHLMIVEDTGGTNGTAYPHSKQPNSFVYRFIPYNPSDLKHGGKLQVLSVLSHRHPGPIRFVSDPDASIKSPDMKDLHTYGTSFETRWVTIHETAKNGFAPFNANALAKTAGGTPFKRPENGQFRPGTNFSEFVFDETGDTDALTEACSEFGGFGSLFHLRMSGNSGFLTLLYLGDLSHSSFDNVAFWDEDRVVFVEDAGDLLHGQRNALDSAYLFDLNVDYSDSSNQPIRLLAEGRDASATLDSQLGTFPDFQNDEDNEITGWHLSDGDPTVGGLLGAKIPRPFKHEWRLFYTQQHGDNNTWEVLKADASEFPGDRY